MQSSAEHGYAQVRKSTASGREVEIQLLTKIAAEMANADPSTPEGFRELVTAVHRNMEMWTALIVDLLQEENKIDQTLKVGLLKLGQFSLVHSRKVVCRQAEPEVLISINRQIAAGLKAQAQNNAEAA
ncbi:flagellar protein FlaF, putative [Parvularcula bermudensis HTCC2503]|uniref:Flagellar protein FlaF, putative n=1 Tax=Parvularcula bermudensis (strain ATCC BAA-594 / HTCC2503 / KCTC 12087) TaxID=314260 RepID=E0TH59_PARBH|nr:flagellar biosynthesis regulator FlaF [Parvularcula bermudensis]ADM09643.1 flagellar protein FlaF, putative [Parvularcula bermudensis HTCC2503]